MCAGLHTKALWPITAGTGWGARGESDRSRVRADVASAADWTAVALRSRDGGRGESRGLAAGASFLLWSRPQSRLRLLFLPAPDRRVECKSLWLKMGVFTGTWGVTAESCPNSEGCADAGGERPANAEMGFRGEDGKVDLVSCFGQA